MIRNGMARPTPQQLAWQDLELGMFCHFGLNTFCDREWGEGEDSPSAFRPLALDARQWVSTAKEAGFRYFMLTAKHHDGFCLWPTKTTDYSVKASPWRGGNGDVVRECADACRGLGMPFGIYISPWDRHDPRYHDEAAYDDVYCEQLKELLTGYGPLVEIWFDGAGSEGRQYDWPRIMALVKEHQPDAMVFNMGAPTVRWVGNEDGFAPYPCWNEAQAARVSMFTNDMTSWLPDTPDWVPAECPVPIRGRHWFWHPNDETPLRSLEELMDMYERSVGHGATLLLNVAPDNRGLLVEEEVRRVLELGEGIRRLYGSPLATGSGGSCVELRLQEAVEVKRFVTMERLEHGERIRGYVIEARINDSWAQVGGGSAIGHKKIDTLPAGLRATEFRVTVTESTDKPFIRSFAIYG
ncbi:alpha-L-fucosidase [Paenibacillus harenae]|uniref:alpha-L-fucosidase n=1 Tax=Paenibacillus harenae TaxID=306543 RepID=UPI000410554D|nr:alpha-L-fucosidase [Paenibacillus harenae]